MSLPTLSASGRTRLLQRLALIGEGELGALRGARRAAMPQAIERSLATPMIRPRLPP